MPVIRFMVPSFPGGRRIRWLVLGGALSSIGLTRYPTGLVAAPISFNNPFCEMTPARFRALNRKQAPCGE